jgi:hypothetical protein
MISGLHPINDHAMLDGCQLDEKLYYLQLNAIIIFQLSFTSCLLQLKSFVTCLMQLDNFVITCGIYDQKMNYPF